jgi:hypothetical protein
LTLIAVLCGFGLGTSVVGIGAAMWRAESVPLDAGAILLLGGFLAWAVTSELVLLIVVRPFLQR